MLLPTIPQTQLNQSNQRMKVRMKMKMMRVMKMNKSMLTVLLILTIHGMMLSQWKMKQLLLFQN